MKTFTYYDKNKKPQIGIEYDNKMINFSLLWQYFKQLKNIPQAPDLYFLQMVVEMEYFSTQILTEIIKTVKDVRPLEDLAVPKDIKYDVPISRPQKIICLGRNYKKHAREFDSTVPEQPMFFSKLPSALLPHGGLVEIPPDIGRVDHEIELAVVIGEQAANISVENVFDYIAGYTIANDVTARTMQKNDLNNGRPWTLSKGLDTFCPMGPFLIPADAIKDPHNLELELKVNGEVRQKSNTRFMVFKIPELVTFISRYMTLQPGDIICTGTPEGVSALKPGDEIVAAIEGLGRLVNTVGVKQN